RPPEAPEAAADSAGAGAWAVPGVDPVPWPPDAASAPDAQRASSDQGADGPASGAVSAEAEGLGREGPEREGGQAASDAAARWREDLHAAASGDGHAHPVVAALATCVEALDGVRDAGVGTLTVREVRVLLLAVVHVVTVAVALQLRLLIAAEAQRVADLTGATGTAAFLAHLTRIDRPDAGGQLRLAKDLHTRYPLLADALAAGTVNLPQLRVCVTALRRLPKALPAAKLADCQRFLIHAAGTLPPRQLKVLGRRLWEVIDPDGAEAKDGKDLQDEEDRARARAWFSSWRNGDGTTGFRGKLPDAQADMLLKLLHAHAAPRRRKNPTIPTSQPDNIRRDTADNPGAGAGDAGADGDGGCGGGCDGSPRDGCLDQESAEEQHTGKQIPYPVRLGHALIDLVERIPAAAVPDTGGVAATIVITLRDDQLRTGLGLATLDTGTPITAAQARRLACEAGLIPMVLDGDSQPLDLGREQRLFNKAQRLAVDHRQHHVCGIHGCDRPITAHHHPHPWNTGGPTNLANALGLCGYHHHLAHHPAWKLVHTDDEWTLKRISPSD
ncbi:MAG TPA: DUF222 domain-containing protein, partial [Nocardioidaceae bacterium]